MASLLLLLAFVLILAAVIAKRGTDWLEDAVAILLAIVLFLSFRPF